MPVLTEIKLEGPFGNAVCCRGHHAILIDVGRTDGPRKSFSVEDGDIDGLTYVIRVTCEILHGGCDRLTEPMLKDVRNLFDDLGYKRRYTPMWKPSFR